MHRHCKPLEPCIAYCRYPCVLILICANLRIGLQFLGKTKVEYFDESFIVKPDVLWLQVTVKDAL
jgi:hypothetical protein